jgi:hypothetical protein
MEGIGYRFFAIAVYCNLYNEKYITLSVFIVNTKNSKVMQIMH